MHCTYLASMDAPPFLVVIVFEILKTINLFTAVYSQNICEFFLLL
jgi:hypothetical protein